MILKRAHVRNFRAIREATVEFGHHTAILGGNGAGKSTVLRALDKFYAPSPNVELDDFFGKMAGHPIEIGLTFTAFSEAERELFGDRVQADEMTVVRVFEQGGGRGNGRYFGSTLQHPPFGQIRSSEGAQEQRRQYNEFRANEPEYDFPPVQRADQIEPILTEWESRHRDQCAMMRDDGQFFGFANVGRGNLQKSTSFVFIPAVRDASADAVDARGAVVARLMELVVRSAVQRRAEIRVWQERIGQEYQALMDPALLPELGDLAGILSSTLQTFYADAGVALQWKALSEFAVPLPTADVLLEEDGFQGPVDRKGHGLQRAFIVSLLQHLALATAADVEQQDVPPEEEGARPPYVLPGLILAIEEPELYQHPTKQRHFANVLRRLTDGSLPGVAVQTQIMFASHSSLFVSLDKFDEVRLARRYAEEDGDTKECRLSRSDLAAVARALEIARNRPEGTYSAEGLRSRLHIVGPELAEGFFADVVVLVEGVSDKAALMAAASLAGFDLEAHGIAVLPTDGKSKMDKPAIIFRELGIPTFLIFDCDLKADGQIKGVEDNIALPKIVGVDAADAQTLVSDCFASFERTLETTLKDELTHDVFARCADEARDEFDLRERSDVTKVPAAMSSLLRRAAALGHRSATLVEIIGNIRRLKFD